MKTEWVVIREIILFGTAIGLLMVPDLMRGITPTPFSRGVALLFTVGWGTLLIMHITLYMRG